MKINELIEVNGEMVVNTREMTEEEIEVFCPNETDITEPKEML